MFIKKWWNGMKDRLEKRNDPLIWSRELEKHYCWDFSYACVRTRIPQASQFSHVEIGSRGVFISIYDGHNGPQVALHCKENLFNHFIDGALREGHVHEGLMTEAVNAMENQIRELATGDITQKYATVGSSCLIGLIRDGGLCVRNLGDGKCIVGFRPENSTIPQPMNHVDNLQDEIAREHFQTQHPGEADAVAEIDGVFLVKGKVKVTRSLGDAYLKYPECAVSNPELVQFHIPEPSSRPYLSAALRNPAQISRQLDRFLKFVIFASSGLWNYLSDAEAVRIVETHPQKGIARILIQEAQKVAAVSNRYSYRNLRNNTENRHEVHDDMTVVVVFLDHEKVYVKKNSQPTVSVQAFSEVNEASRFQEIHRFL